VALSRSRTVAATLLIVAVALGVASSAALGPEVDARASIATLTVVDGDVLVHHAGADLAPARVGDVVFAGDAIHAGTGAAAEITYFEGSSVRVEAGTKRVEKLGAAPGGGAVVGLHTLGRAWDVITKLVSGDSRYDIRVPSSTASVRG
jgi:hypothetical protein